MPNTILNLLNAELGRMLATATALVLALILSKLWQRYLNVRQADVSLETKRQKLVVAKNAIWGTAFFIILGIWGSKIAGVALSLAAVAGAILLVSKELLMNLLGFVYFNVARPFTVGDHVTIGTSSGRVIDISALSLTLAQSVDTGLLTGRRVTLPNSALLSGVVVNSSTTGSFILCAVSIVVPYSEDLAKATEFALEAANSVTSQWQEQAARHFQRIEDRSFIDLPSVKPRAVWEAYNEKCHRLTVRCVCPAYERISTEQQVFLRFHQALAASKAAAAAGSAKG